MKPFDLELAKAGYPFTNVDYSNRVLTFNQGNTRGYTGELKYVQTIKI